MAVSAMNGYVSRRINRYLPGYKVNQPYVLGFCLSMFLGPLAGPAFFVFQHLDKRLNEDWNQLNAYWFIPTMWWWASLDSYGRYGAVLWGANVVMVYWYLMERRRLTRDWRPIVKETR